MNLSHSLPSAALLLFSPGLCTAQPAPDSWESYMMQGDAARKARQYKKADTLYQAGSAEARKLGPSDTRMAPTLVALASMYEEAGNHSALQKATDSRWRFAGCGAGQHTDRNHQITTCGTDSIDTCEVTQYT
jgi:hypothetical protein